MGGALLPPHEVQEFMSPDTSGYKPLKPGCGGGADQLRLEEEDVDLVVARRRVPAEPEVESC